jgi:hypothetical protein
MCDACVLLICRLLDDAAIMSGSRGVAGDLRHDPTAAHLPRRPLTVEQKLAWVRRYLPLTAAVMDLNGMLASAERRSTYRA